LTEQQVAARRAAENLEHSVAGRLGHTLEPVFRPLGFDWKIVTAMMGAFAAKEIFVAQMASCIPLADADKEQRACAQSWREITVHSWL